MKLKKLKLQNFARFQEFECIFNDKITHLVGINASGKTTVGLTAIWACLKGISEKSKDGQLLGERFRFIGSKKASADLELTLVDEVKGAEIIVKNHLTKQGNQITFEAPEHYPINNEWVNNLLSVAFLSAKNFTQLDSKQQALLLGIDTHKYDVELQGLKQEYTGLNREYKSFGEIPEVEKVEKVSLSLVLQQKDEIDTFNATQLVLQNKREKIKDQIETLQKEKDRQIQQLKEIKQKIQEQEDQLERIEQPQQFVDSSPIKEAIQTAEKRNQQATLWEQTEKKKQEKNLKLQELEQNKEEQKLVEGKRLKHIQSFNFGFKSLTVDEDGGLLLNDRPIREPYFSKGELEIIVARLYSVQNPEWKVRFIDDFELLDEANQVKLLDYLLKKDFQVITALLIKPDTKQGQDNIVMLRECEIEKESIEDKETILI